MGGKGKCSLNADGIIYNVDGNLGNFLIKSILMMSFNYRVQENFPQSIDNNQSLRMLHTEDKVLIA